METADGRNRDPARPCHSVEKYSTSSLTTNGCPFT